MELSPGEKLNVEVQGMGSLGEGLARHEGAEIFIPKTAPGDQVEIEILEKKKGRYRGRVLKLIKASNDRVTPHCKHFEKCGGCDFQHLPYDQQFEWKVRMTKHWIRRSPLAPQLEKIPFDFIPSPHPYGYRHRARLQVQNGKIHFFLPHSNDLFEIEECPIMVDGFVKALQDKASGMPATKDWNQSFLNEKLVEDKTHYTIDDHKLCFDESCFTQANLPVNELIWNRIKEDVEKLEQKEKALDLYCGIGNFSFGLSKQFKKVVGVESFGNSIEWAKKNSKELNVENIEWRPGLVEEILPELDAEKQYFDFVLLDPPRAGTGKACKALLEYMPPRITYISCHLESLTRDLVQFCKKGPYKISRWTIADMFPQTHHIESIVSLEYSP